MAYARKYNNGVVLPTGEVLVIGGNTSGEEFSDDGTILTPEIWNPNTQTWRTVAAHSEPRNYHSVALLMTDGRVFSGGGGLCNCSADHPDHQVYSPPYLFNADGSLATRPVISSAPAVVSYGRTINVAATPGMQKFSLIKMSGVTHNLNSDLRYLSVPFSEVSSGQYQLRLHSNRNVMTPGYWMLFAVNEPRRAVSGPGHCRQQRRCAGRDQSGWAEQPGGKRRKPGYRRQRPHGRFADLQRQRPAPRVEHRSQQRRYRRGGDHGWPLYGDRRRV